MTNRTPRGRSEQPSLQPLLQSAQRSEKHEDEVDDVRVAAQFLVDLFAGKNSTAPSTTSKELPEMEASKEVAVQSVNPSLQIQDGEEHVTSMANSLQGEGSEELTGPAVPSAIAVRDLQGASYLHPLLIEESESDSELPTSIHPSSAPEGSLLHALYLHLVGAGTDGITVRELFKCLKKPAEVLSFKRDWKAQVRRHLKTNTHFCEAKGYHYLVSKPQLEVQQTKRSPANIASTSRRYGALSSKTVLSSHQSTPATVQTGLSVDAHEGVVRTRRRAFQKAIAALSEQAAAEFEERHHSMDDMQMPSSVAVPTDSQLISHGPLLPTSSKRKCPSSDDEELAHHGHPISGGLQATQSEIFAKTEVQTGQSCVVQKVDSTGNWRCDMMAMAGDTLCQLRRSLPLQGDGETSLSPNPGSPKHLTAFKTGIAQDVGVQTGGQCKCGSLEISRPDPDTNHPSSPSALWNSKRNSSEE